MKTQKFIWTDKLVLEFNSMMFAFGKPQEQRLKEFKEMIINKSNKQ